ncbi:MAG: ABC-2 family transporter protein [Acidimicrobiales bacterium]
MTAVAAAPRPRYVAAFLRSLRLTAARTAVGRGGLVVAGFFYLMVTSILSELWKVAALANGGEVAGYSASALVWYIATSESVTIPLPIKLIDDIGIEIADDTLAVELLRPIPPIVVRIGAQFGMVLPRLVVCAGLGLGFAYLSGGAPLSPAALLLAAPSVVLALLLNVCAQHLFASGAFWVSDAKSTWFLYQKLVFVTGGMLLPLEVLPPTVESVTRWLPFMAMAYAPARLASGHFEPELLLIQAGWLIVLGVGAWWAFDRGQRHLMGGRS